MFTGGDAWIRLWDDYGVVIEGRVTELRRRKEGKKILKAADGLLSLLR